MLLQKAVIIDPYARSIVGRHQYGQLAQVRVCFDSVAILSQEKPDSFWATLIGKLVHICHAMQHAWQIMPSQPTSQMSLGHDMHVRLVFIE